MLPPAAAPLRLAVQRWKDGQQQGMEEIASREERVLVHMGGASASLWACPLDLEVLALGHVLLDCQHGTAPDAPHSLPCGCVERLPAPAGEHHFQVRFDSEQGRPAPIMEPGSATPAQITDHMCQMLELPGLWDGTGCFHRAAMVHIPSRRIVLMSEDIGRHNCLDRLAGLCAMQGLNPSEYALCITARITASLYEKARRAGFLFLVSRAAVTSASVLKAKEQGVTLVGYCRSNEGRCTVFADEAGRVRWEEHEVSER